MTGPRTEPAGLRPADPPTGAGPSPPPGAWTRLRRGASRVVTAWPLHAAILLAEIGGFSYLWTAFDRERYLSLHLYAFDFGVSIRDVWAASSGPIISEHMIANLFVLAYWAIPSQGAFFVFLLAFQNVFVFLGAIPVYLIARGRLQSGLAGLAFASAYVLYPVLTGMLWFPFHFEAFFPTLFLTGYWLYRADRWVLSAAVLSVATLTNIGSPLIVGAVGAGLLLEALGPRLVDRLRGRSARLRLPRPRTEFSIFLIGVSIAVLLVVVYGQGLISTSSLVERSVSPSEGAISIAFDPFGGAASKLLVVFLVFAPLLLLPLWAREERWALAIFWAPALLTANSVFLDPFHDQYGCLLAPVAFAAAIRGLERWRDGSGAAPTSRPDTATGAAAPEALRHRIARWTLRRPEPVAGAVLGLVAVSASLLFPWSPWNGALAGLPAEGFEYPTLTYEPSAFTDGNLTIDAHILALAAALPSNGPALVEDNLPELFERQGTVLTSCFGPDVPVQYVVTDPYDASFLSPFTYPPGCPSTVSMYWWSDHFLSLGWRVIGEADGAVALAPNVTGNITPLAYFPATDRYGTDAFAYPSGTGGPLWDRTGGGVFFDGPTEAPWGGTPMLFPGRFWVNLTLAVDHPSASSRAEWSLTPSNGSGTGFNVTLDGAAWANTTGDVEVSVLVASWEYVIYPEFSLRVQSWDGGLGLVGLTLRQASMNGTAA